MIAKQSVFLTLDRSRAVVAGDPEAKYLLCRAGMEVHESTLQRHQGALALAGAEATKKSSQAPATPPVPATRTPALETRVESEKPTKVQSPKKKGGRPPKKTQNPKEEKAARTPALETRVESEKPTKVQSPKKKGGRPPKKTQNPKEEKAEDTYQY